MATKMSETVAILVAVITALGALVLGVINIWSSRRKSSAEIRALDINTYDKQLKMINDLRGELEEERIARRADRDRLNARLAEVEAKHAEEIQGLTERIRALEEENHSLLRENRRLRSEKGIS